MSLTIQKVASLHQMRVICIAQADLSRLISNRHSASGSNSTAHIDLPAVEIFLASFHE
jgi:hypothetical protein